MSEGHSVPTKLKLSNEQDEDIKNDLANTTIKNEKTESLTLTSTSTPREELDTFIERVHRHKNDKVVQNHLSKEDVCYILMREVCLNLDAPANDAMMRALTLFRIVQESLIEGLTATETVPTKVLGLITKFKEVTLNCKELIEVRSVTNRHGFMYSHDFLVSQQINGIDTDAELTLNRNNRIDPHHEVLMRQYSTNTPSSAIEEKLQKIMSEEEDVYSDSTEQEE